VPTLYIFSGLPGTGKSTLAKIVAQHYRALYLRIDTIEQGLRDLCSLEIQGEGYRLSYRIASDNLRLGLNVVADSCNPIELTRREWEQVARGAEADFRNIEIICSDAAEHRVRIETRRTEPLGPRLPTWDEVENREYHPWTVDRIIVDTAGRSVTEAANELIAQIDRAFPNDRNVR
jgi:predicted kinase